MSSNVAGGTFPANGILKWNYVVEEGADACSQTISDISPGSSGLGIRVSLFSIPAKRPGAERHLTYLRS